MRCAAGSMVLGVLSVGCGLDVYREPGASDGEPASSSAGSSDDGSTSEPDPEDLEPPLPAYDGEPLPAAPTGKWVWVDFPDAFCRDGTSTGIGVRYGETDDLVIYFEGG